MVTGSMSILIVGRGYRKKYCESRYLVRSFNRDTFSNITKISKFSGTLLTDGLNCWMGRITLYDRSDVVNGLPHLRVASCVFRNDPFP